jgi:tetratricopeptide (TPR) repeat protein
MDIKETVRHYQQALAQQPNSAELHYNLAVLLHQLGEWQGAIESYEQAVALKQDYPKAYFNLGLIYDRNGQLEEAIQNYRKAIEYNRNYTKAYSNLGCVLAKQKNFEAAIEVFQQAVVLNPVWATLHNNMGQVWLAQGQVDKAIEAYRKAIKLDPQMVLAHHNLGRLWLQQQNYAAAIECLEKVIALEPNNVAAYSECGSAFMAQSKPDKAMECFRQAIALQPIFVEAYCRKALFLKEEDLLDRAKIACARFLQALQQQLDLGQIYQYLWQTYCYLGDVWFEYGGYKQAEVYYEKALEIKPNDVDRYLSLGNCLTKQKRLEEAVIVYQLGLLVSDERPQLLLQLGNVLEKQKRLEEAIGYYEQVLQLQLDGVLDSSVKLPHLNPAASSSPNPPKAIYRFTEDWFDNLSKEAKLAGYNYVEVIWEHLPGWEMQREKVSNFLAPVIEPSVRAKKTQSECGGLTCTTCTNKLINFFEPIQLGKGVYFCSQQQSPPIEPAKTFVVTIPEGKAWIAPQKSYWMICNAIAIVTPDNYLLGDLSRYYPWYLPVCEEYDLSDHPFFTLEETPPLEEIEGTVAVLSGLSGNMYYHWTIDILPRIEILRRSGIDIDRIDKFVVNNIKQPFQKETLNALGIPNNKIIESDIHPYIKAEKLVVPSFPGHLDWINRGTIEFLREAFSSKTSLYSNNYPERIYISRAKAKYRHIINEKEMTELLRQFGFVTIFTEEMSVLDQVSLFASAKAIVAAHGSALTNIVFCQEGTNVIELFSPNYVRTDYWIVSQYLKLNHYYLKGVNFECQAIRQLMESSPLTDDILVDLSALESLLRAF